MSGPRLAYCTNVHAGADLPAVLENLRVHAAAVRADLHARRAAEASAPDPGERLGVGLWLAADAVRTLRDEALVPGLRDALDELGLACPTLNAFPYEDFHQRTVKHAVYRPDWTDPRRLAYTRDCVRVLAELLPEGGAGGVSTLPLGWERDRSSAWRDRTAAALRHVADACARVEDETGRCVHVDLEPEPGCTLDRGRDLVRFFEDHLLHGLDAAAEARVRRHVRACLDTCHVAVMHEAPGAVVDAWAAAGIAVGKVQVSSALEARFDEADATGRRAMLSALESFVEPRYLHQVVVRGRRDGPVRWHDDLPDALGSATPETTAGERWRVHFHVPIHLESIGPLATTRPAIAPALAALARHGARPTLEVETYAWTVLPDSLRPATLAEGIATELKWLEDALADGLEDPIS